ncbi:replication initiator 1-like isoform X2 [Paramacrobiotus metropolitanus]|uniref:replication initiator 1-like isoform X2 n=1 Tax=Paramacrobiotus metropolitanus TaxID=2943436 RepID=UPI0024459395|nr:replication initiator 1-like isoform X2 [Paramacrobiotus metropolitanus]
MDFINFEVHFPGGSVREFLLNASVSADKHNKPSYSFSLLRMLIADKIPKDFPFTLTWQDRKGKSLPVARQQDLDAIIDRSISHSGSGVAALTTSFTIAVQVVREKLDGEKGAENQSEMPVGSSRHLTAQAPLDPAKRTIQTRQSRRRSHGQAASDTEKVNTVLTGIGDSKPGGARYYPCEKCSTNFFSQLALDRHVEICSLPKTEDSTPKDLSVPDEEAERFSCEKCSCIFFSKTTLDKHVTTCSLPNAKETKYTCDNCSAEFLQQSYLDEHKYAKICTKEVSEKMTKIPSVHACAKCGLKFSSENKLAEHELTKHITREFICEYCGKGLDNKMVLDYHATACRRSSAGSVFCPQCRSSFPNEDELRQHFRTDHPGLKLVKFVPPERPESPVVEKAASPSIDEVQCLGEINRQLPKIRMGPRPVLRMPLAPLTCCLCGMNFFDRQQFGFHLMSHSALRSPAGSAALPLSFPTPPVFSRPVVPVAPHPNGYLQRLPTVFPSVGIVTPRPAPPFVLINSVDGQFPCKACGQVFTKNLDLGKHLLEHIAAEKSAKINPNGDSKWEAMKTTCALCLKQCGSPADLENHLFQHFIEHSKSAPNVLDPATSTARTAQAPAQGPQDQKICPKPTRLILPNGRPDLCVSAAVPVEAQISSCNKTPVMEVDAKKKLPLVAIPAKRLSSEMDEPQIRAGGLPKVKRISETGESARSSLTDNGGLKIEFRASKCSVENAALVFRRAIDSAYAAVSSGRI